MWIEWSRHAKADVQRIIAYLRNDDPRTAQSVAARIFTATEKLSGFPGLGRPGRVEGTRELLVQGLPYVSPYVEEEDRVVIVRVLHTPMRWPG